MTPASGAGFHRYTMSNSTPNLSLTVRHRRSLWPVSTWRASRLAISASLAAVALEAGIPASLLSEVERGLKPLTEEQQARLLAALERLRDIREEETAATR